MQSAKYELMLTVNSGMLGSVAIPGFSVAVRAIFDEKEHVKVLQDIFTSV